MFLAALGKACLVRDPEVAAAGVEDHFEFLHRAAEADRAEVLRSSERFQHHGGFVLSPK